MNENRRGDDFNEIVSIIKELFDENFSCQLEITERNVKHYNMFKSYLFNRHPGKETVVTLTFR